MHELDAIIALIGQMFALAKWVDSLSINIGEVNIIQSSKVFCEGCGGNHATDRCMNTQESVQYVRNFNRNNNFEHL